MSHYWLLAALPPRPVEPGAPEVSREALLTQCREELAEPDIAAVEALVELYAPPTTDGAEAAREHRARVEQAQARAEEAGRGLLVEWLEFEQGLREALAGPRAAALGRRFPAPPPAVADTAARLDRVVAEARGAPEPRARARILDRARLQELERLCGPDEFSTEAVLAQIAAALVTERWAPASEGEALEEEWR